MRDHILPTKSRERIAAENRAELDAWIDERVEALVARGMSPDDARRQALQEFGDADVAERYAGQQDVAADRRVRVLLWLDELLSDARIAARTLTRTPTVTAVVLLTFALGIGATTAVFSVVHAMLLRPLPYAGEAGIVYLPAVDDGVIRPGLGGARHSATAVVSLRERTTSFSALSAVSMGNGVLRGEGDPEQIWIVNGTPNVFEVLAAKPALGRAFTADEFSSPVILLLDGLWRRRFGADSGVIGRTIDFSGTRFEIIGVMPPGFHVPTYEQAELLAPGEVEKFSRNPNTAHVRVQRFARAAEARSVAGRRASRCRSCDADASDGASGTLPWHRNACRTDSSCHCRQCATAAARAHGRGGVRATHRMCERRGNPAVTRACEAPRIVGSHGTRRRTPSTHPAVSR